MVLENIGGGGRRCTQEEWCSQKRANYLDFWKKTIYFHINDPILQIMEVSPWRTALSNDATQANG